MAKSQILKTVRSKRPGRQPTRAPTRRCIIQVGDRFYGPYVSVAEAKRTTSVLKTTHNVSIHMIRIATSELIDSEN